MLRKKILKFWKYRLELKLSKLTDKEKIEFLANKLVKELNINVDPQCESIDIWIHNKKYLNVSYNTAANEIRCKYTGR